MKKKILIIICAICFIVSCSIGLVACGSNNDDDGGTEQRIVATFTTDHGDLSFSQKSLYLNEEGYATISLQDFPTISNEGDAYLFSHWIDKDGTKIDSDRQLTEDTEFKAFFVDAKIVVKTKWYQNQSMMSKEYSTLSSTLGKHSYGGSDYNRNFKFVKVSKTEATEKNYLLKSELDDYATACFVSSSNNIEKIVSKSDLTTNTYMFNCYIVISPDNDIVRSFGFFDYLPKNVKPDHIAINNVLMLAVQYNYGYGATSTDLKGAQSVQCLLQNSSLSNEQSKISNIRSCKSLSSFTSNDFTSDQCFLFIEATGFKFSYNNTTKTVYNCTVPNDGRLNEDVSKSYFDSVTY